MGVKTHWYDPEGNSLEDLRECIKVFQKNLGIMNSGDHLKKIIENVTLENETQLILPPKAGLVQWE
jgi:hypothetical protein